MPTVPELGWIAFVLIDVYSTQMLFVPVGGAEVNVSVLLSTVNAPVGFWGTFSMNTKICAAEATLRDSVNAVVDALPLK